MYIHIPKSLKVKKVVRFTPKELKNFETEIAKSYNDALIRGPIHLSSGNEKQLIKIFKFLDQIWFNSM